jgi:hypothetical protein
VATGLYSSGQVEPTGNLTLISQHFFLNEDGRMKEVRWESVLSIWTNYMFNCGVLGLRLKNCKVMTVVFKIWPEILKKAIITW